MKLRGNWYYRFQLLTSHTSTTDAGQVSGFMIGANAKSSDLSERKKVFTPPFLSYYLLEGRN